jgi:mRNA interferase MazF
VAHRVVVLSSDLHNERVGAKPFCAPIVRQPSPVEFAPFVVPLHETDAITGSVVVAKTAPIALPPDAVRGGMVTGPTANALSEALRALFDL